MILKKLTLEDFRNYGTVDLDFEPNNGITYICGDNAQGKTNILEAIYILALTKSFRAAANLEMIGWDSEYCRITGLIETSTGPKSLEIFYGKPPQPQKALKINGVKTSGHNFIGNCNIVFFHPEDLNMLYLGPNLRRRYLDIMNLQVNGRYYLALRRFRRILDQRNSLLKRINERMAVEKDLDIWDEQLTDQGEIIAQTREKAVEFINIHLQQIYHKISGGTETIAANYQNSAGGNYRQTLAENRQKDLRAQFTTIGPHRDDLQFILNGRLIAEHASRGEYRSLLLALKLLEIRYYEQMSGEKPILLLDDVFSELDEKRSATLMQEIDGQQTFLTTTHMPENDRSHRNLSTCIVENGKITKQKAAF